MAYLIVETPLQETILEAILPDDVLKHLALVVAGERSNPTPIANTLLITRRQPVAILMDSHSVDEGTISEKRVTVRDILQMVAGRIPAACILFVPTVEMVFFQAPSVLEKTFGQQTPSDIAILARYSPKEALAQWMTRAKGPRNVEQLIKSLDDEQIETMRSTGPISELLEFLKQAAKKMAQPNVA